MPLIQGKLINEHLAFLTSVVKGRNCLFLRLRCEEFPKSKNGPPILTHKKKDNTTKTYNHKEHIARLTNGNLHLTFTSIKQER